MSSSSRQAPHTPSQHDKIAVDKMTPSDVYSEHENENNSHY